MKNNLNIEHKLEYAQVLEDNGQLLHALQVYKKLIEENPDLNELYFRLAELYQKMDNPDAAIDLIKENLNNSPDNIEARIFLSHYFLDLQKWEDAAEQMSYISEKDEPVIRFFEGFAHYKMKDYEIALLKFQQFLRNNKKRDLKLEAFSYLAKIHYKLSNDDEALKYAQKAHVIFSDHWEINFLLSKIYARKKMFMIASDYVKKALRFNPHNFKVFLLAGKISYQLDDYKSAKKYLLKSIELNQKISAENYYLLGNVYLKNGSFDEAINYYDIAIKSEPDYALALKARQIAQIKKDKNSPDD